MGATIEEILERQIKFAREQYGRVVELGWKDNKLDALKSIPPARLDMLLDNRELFHDYDFDDCPVSAAERKALGSDMPWAVFVTAARVATDSNLSSDTVADRLRAMADELGMNEEQAREAERDVLGGPTVKDLLERLRREAVQTVLREYRKRVEEVWADGKLSHNKIKKLKASANKLGLVKEQTEDIERKVTGNTAFGILAEDNAVSQLLEKHDIARSQVKGSDKKGRITKQDVERYIASMPPPGLPNVPPPGLPSTSPSGSPETPPPGLPQTFPARPDFEQAAEEYLSIVVPRLQSEGFGRIESTAFEQRTYRCMLRKTGMLVGEIRFLFADLPTPSASSLDDFWSTFATRLTADVRVIGQKNATACILVALAERMEEPILFNILQKNKPYSQGSMKPMYYWPVVVDVVRKQAFCSFETPMWGFAMWKHYEGLVRRTLYL